MNIKVSIVIAVYNAEHCLQKCLDSVVNQTYKNIEIICVNDASVDKSQLIIERFKNIDSRVKCIMHKENTNAGGAMNDGIKQASGDYICIVDNDDWLKLDAVEKMVTASNNGEFDVVSCDWCRYFDKQKFSDVRNLPESKNRDDIINYSFLYGFRLLGALIRKALFISNDLFFPERKFYEDNAVGNCILCCARTIYPLHEVLYYYNVSTISVTRSLSLQKVLDRMYTTELFMENLKRRGFYTEKNKSLIEYRYIYLNFATLKMLFSINNRKAFCEIKSISKKVNTLLPNSYVSRFHPEYCNCFKYPFLFCFLFKVKMSIKSVSLFIKG